jgi:hypothetical protein
MHPIIKQLLTEPFGMPRVVDQMSLAFGTAAPNEDTHFQVEIQHMPFSISFLFWARQMRHCLPCLISQKTAVRPLHTTVGRICRSENQAGGDGHYPHPRDTYRRRYLP